MISRRNFLKTAAASTAAAPLTENAGAAPDTHSENESRRPLRAEPRRRVIYAKPALQGGLRLYSDGSQNRKTATWVGRQMWPRSSYYPSLVQTVYLQPNPRE